MGQNIQRGPKVTCKLDKNVHCHKPSNNTLFKVPVIDGVVKKLSPKKIRFRGNGSLKGLFLQRCKWP
jgi:hypothetical protein